MTMQNDAIEVEEYTQSSKERTAEMRQNPASRTEEAEIARGGEALNATDGTVSSNAEEHIPSPSDPAASDVPSTYKVSSQPESLEGEAAVGEGVNPEDED
jgi:hypothetical protein